MKFFRYLESVLVLMMVCLLSTSAMANPTNEGAGKGGLVLEAGIGVPITRNAGINGNDNGMSGAAYNAVGVGVNLTFGYRWDVFAISLNQDLGGQFVTDSAIADSWKLITNEKASYFLGGTYLMFEENFTVSPSFLITISEGLGAMYGADMKFHAFWVDSDAAFAIKFSAAFHYFIKKKYGIGVKLEYAAALAIDNGIATSHFIQPVISFKTIF